MGVDWGKQGNVASFWFARRLASRISCRPLPSTSLLSFPPPLLFQLVWIPDARVLAGVGGKVLRLSLSCTLFPRGRDLFSSRVIRKIPAPPFLALASSLSLQARVLGSHSFPHTAPFPLVCVESTRRLGDALVPEAMPYAAMSRQA